MTKAKVEKIAELASKEGKIRTVFGMETVAFAAALPIIGFAKSVSYCGRR